MLFGVFTRSELKFILNGSKYDCNPLQIPFYVQLAHAGVQGIHLLMCHVLFLLGMLSSRCVSAFANTLGHLEVWSRVFILNAVCV